MAHYLCLCVCMCECFCVEHCQCIHCQHFPVITVSLLDGGLRFFCSFCMVKVHLLSAYGGAARWLAARRDIYFSASKKPTKPPIPWLQWWWSERDFSKRCGLFLPCFVAYSMTSKAATKLRRGGGGCSAHNDTHTHWVVALRDSAHFVFLRCIFAPLSRSHTHTHTINRNIC